MFENFDFSKMGEMLEIAQKQAQKMRNGAKQPPPACGSRLETALCGWSDWRPEPVASMRGGKPVRACGW